MSLSWTEHQPAGDVDLSWDCLAMDADGSHVLAGYTPSGRLYLTTNGGASWNEVQPAGDVDLAWVCAAMDADGSHMVAGVYNGRLYMSTDGGASWSEKQPAGNNNRYWEVAAMDSDGSHILVAAFNARAYYSIDGGATWPETQPAGDSNKYWEHGAVDADGSHAVITGSRVYITTNGAASWSEKQPAGDNNLDWWVAAIDGDGSHIMVGVLDGRLYLSTDGGTTWPEVQPAGNTDEYWYAGAMDSDGSHILAVCYMDGRAWLSTDGGATWGEELAGTDRDWVEAEIGSDGSAAVMGAWRLYLGASATPPPPPPVFTPDPCETPEAGYVVRLKDTSGAVVAIFDNWLMVEYCRQLNTAGYHEVHLNADDPRLELFTPDAQVEFWRQPTGEPWRMDFETFHRRRRWATDQSGVELFSSIGRGYNELLDRRIMLPPGDIYVGDAYDEYGPDELTDIMRDMAYAHCGLGAAAARQMPGFAVEADDNTGPILSVKFRYDNLLTAMQHMADLGADFQIVGTGAAAFEFRAYFPRLGLDRTVGNLDGNDPVIFAVDRGNMANPEVIESWLTLRNAVYVGGQGQGAARTIETNTDPVSIAETPWGRREGFYDQRQYDDTEVAQLQNSANAYLAQNTKATEFKFDALEQPSARYGVDYDLGDLLTATYRGYTFSVRVTEVHITVSRGMGEQVRPTFQVIYTD